MQHREKKQIKEKKRNLKCYTSGTYYLFQLKEEDKDNYER